MNIWDIVISAVLAVIIIMAFRKVIKDKKAGKCSCGNCSGCGTSCMKKQEK